MVIADREVGLLVETSERLVELARRADFSPEKFQKILSAYPVLQKTVEDVVKMVNDGVLPPKKVYPEVGGRASLPQHVHGNTGRRKRG